MNCQVLYTFNQIFGNMAIGLASINLSIRTIAVWSQRLYVVVPLVAGILGHWVLLLHGLLIKAAWVDPEGCVITETDNHLLAITFIYSMAFDLVVLCLTAWKLVFAGTGRSRLVNLIFGDGLIFFIVAYAVPRSARFLPLTRPSPSFLANLLATVSRDAHSARGVRN